jgi:hypothetical protein
MEDMTMPKDYDYTTLEGRIAAHCEWFNMEPPTLEYDEDEPTEVLLTEDLVSWVWESGGSMDWLLIGDPKGMALAFVEKHRGSRELLNAIRELDRDTQKFLIDLLQEHFDGKINFEEVISRTEEYKANRSAA